MQLSRRQFATLLAAAPVAGAMFPRQLLAQERFSLFVPSTQESVERMVALAEVRPNDHVMDLGSGDGRIVFTAARGRSRVTGVGVEINAELVEKSNAQAKKDGVADRIRFVHQNVFDADVSKADIVFMWLFPELLRLLRPKLINEMRPGSRIVTATWDLGGWTPDRVDDKGGAIVRLWVVPARIGGEWQWDLGYRGRSHRYVGLVEQYLHNVEVAVRVGVRRELVAGLSLRGDQLQFSLRVTVPGVGVVNHVFNGRVSGERITGEVVLQVPKSPHEEQVTEEIRLPWNAERVPPGGYFAFTGTDIGQR